MKTPTLFIVSVTLLIAVVFGGLAPAYAEYTLSVTPRYSAEEMLARLGPLAQILTEQLHSPVEIVLTKSFEEYEKRLQNGKIDIAFSNPTHYAKATSHEVVAMESKDIGPRMRGIIIVRTDSLIASIYNLIGRSVAIVSWQSTGGFLSQKVFLEKQGIQVKTQLKLEEAHDNKQENVILAVYHGDVDAGFINEDSLHIVDNYVPTDQIRVLERTTWLPNWALSVRRTLPEMVKDRVKQAVLGLKPGHKVLSAMNLQEFVAATDKDYDVIRQALGIAIAPPQAPVAATSTQSLAPVLIPTTATSANKTTEPVPEKHPVTTKPHSQSTTTATEAPGTKVEKPTEATQSQLQDRQPAVAKKATKKRKAKSHRTP